MSIYLDIPDISSESYQSMMKRQKYQETSSESWSERNRLILVHTFSYFSRWILRQMKALQLSEMVWKHLWLGSVSLQLKFGSKLRISPDSPWLCQAEGALLSHRDLRCEMMPGDVGGKMARCEILLLYVCSMHSIFHGHVGSPAPMSIQLEEFFLTLMIIFYSSDQGYPTVIRCFCWVFTMFSPCFHLAPPQMIRREDPPGGLARLRRCGALVLRSPQSAVFLERVAKTPGRIGTMAISWWFIPRIVSGWTNPGYSNGIGGGNVHFFHWGELTHLRFVGWTTK